MLEAMVEALRAGVPAASPEPAGPQPADSPTDAGPVMPVVPAMRESELLASFAELAAFPIPPPETGAAVIFSLRTEAPSAPEATMADLAATAPEGAAATEPAAEELFEEVAPDHELVAFLFGPEGEAAAAASEAAARAAPSSGPADDPPVAADDRPAPEHPPAPEDPIASEKAQTQAPSQPPPSRAGLPAVDLMSEAPATASAALPETSAPPAQDMPAAAAEAPPKELPAAEAIAAEAPSPEPEASPPETSAPDHPLPATGDEPAAPRARDNAGQTRDPLAPLKAMSEEERIALFS
jgi:hypothetical protein